VSLIAVTCALGAVLVTRVQLLPDVIDFTFVLTSAGFGGLVLMALGIALRMTPDRLGRVTVLGQLLGAVAGGLVLVIAIVAG
jgi:hypothetical protein